jgi:hypothetical protein
MRKTANILLTIAVFSSVLMGCAENTVSKAEYDSLKSELDALKSSVANNESESSSKDNLTDDSQEDAVSGTVNNSEAELTLGSTFNFDDLEITIGESLNWVKLTNSYSEYNNADVIEIPIKVKNLKDETHGLSFVYCSFYGSKGTKLEDVGAYFDNDAFKANKMRTGATREAHMHILYDGDGDYFLEIDNISDKFEIKIPVKK